MKDQNRIFGKLLGHLRVVRALLLCVVEERQSRVDRMVVSNDCLAFVDGVHDLLADSGDLRRERAVHGLFVFELPEKGSFLFILDNVFEGIFYTSFFLCFIVDY